MNRARGARIGLRLVAALLGLTLGCSSVRTIPVGNIPAQGQGKTRVVMRDGYVYNFTRVTVRGDSLVGAYPVTEERTGPDGEVIYVDLTRQTVLPVASVTRLEIRRWDPSKSVLLGAGGVLFAIWLHQAFTTEKKETVDYGNTKPPR